MQPQLRQSVFIGTMSGTSLDGLDLVAVEFDDHDQPSLLASQFETYPAQLKQNLRTLVQDPDSTVSLLAESDTQLGKFCAEKINAFCTENSLNKEYIRAIGSHGQTIRHAPNCRDPYTLQIGDPNIIAAVTGIDVVADFRRRDIALGGQGAPFACAYHEKLFRDPEHNRVIVNIGGIANITCLPRDPNQSVIGFDSGPGNTLLDEISRKHLNQEFDKDGEFARQGKVISDLAEQILTREPYFKQHPPKSTGTDHFSPAWLEKTGLTKIKKPADLMATVVELVALSIARAIHQTGMNTDAVYICGGGAHNRYLIERLQLHCGKVPVTSTQTLGLDPDWVEAITFAWLARQTLERKPANLPSVTKAKKFTILGAVYFHRQSESL